MAKNRGAATPAVAALLAAGVRYTLHAYEHDADSPNQRGPASTHHVFADEAAAALGVAPERLFKTLIVDSSATSGANPRLSVALVPASGQLDLRALARVLSVKKLNLADPEVAARSTGYVVGGISPLGQRHALPTVIDESAAEFETIFASAGRRGLQLELAPGDLAKLTSARWATIRH